MPATSGIGKKTIQDVNIRGKRLLIRVDFNVPQAKDGRITDDARIRASLPTIRYAIEQGASVILMSHLGRPDGQVVESLRLTPIAKHLSGLLHRPVMKLDDCIGQEVRQRIATLKPGDLALLENLRFHPAEEKNDPAFAKQLAELADVYVNDAFGTAHRAHASTTGIAADLPAVAGLLLAREIDYLEQATQRPIRPYVAILGGAKVSDKIGVLTNLLERVDRLLIGGGMAYTFLKAQGFHVGQSRVEPEKLELARAILDQARKSQIPIILPVDHVAVQEFRSGAASQTFEYNGIGTGIEDGWEGVDVGPQTVERFKQVLRGAKTVAWNGPLGAFEVDPFGRGTQAVGEFLATLPGVTTIIGGGDTGAAVAKFGLEAHMTHVSTGGGASLEFLEGKLLPGIACLQEK